MSILFPSLTLLLILVALVVVVLLLVSRKHRKVSEPSCGRCGYVVRGLPTFTCPECGADLREVGILTPTMSRPLGPAAYLILWTLAIPIFACPISGMVVQYIPRQHTIWEELMLRGPTSQQYRQIAISAEGTGYRNDVRLQRLSMTLLDGQGVAYGLEVDLASMQILPGSAGIGQPIDVSREALSTWMSAAGVDMTDPRTQTEIDELLSLTRGIASGARLSHSNAGSFQNRSFSASSASVTTPWLNVLTGLFWILIWLLGFRYIWRRRSRSSSA